MPTPDSILGYLWGRLLQPLLGSLWTCQTLWHVLGLLFLSVLALLVTRWEWISHRIVSHTQSLSKAAHDADIFRRADAILCEELLNSLGDDLLRDVCSFSKMLEAHRFCGFMSMSGNQLFSESLRLVAAELVTSLERLDTFVGASFFTYTPGNDLLVLFPELKHSDPSLYEAKGRECAELTRAALSAYTAYRLAVKKELVV